ncbi:MAG: hypothetical protein ACR2FU_08625 [Streptosporangiaceae bacterium]
MHRFNHDYAQAKSFWTVAPSNPQAFGLFSGSSTYDRPGIGYIALRQILGHGNFTRALQQIQRTYGGGSVTEAQLEAEFQQWLPAQTSACHARLGAFFRQWWDTAYQAGSAKPQITGPGLHGHNFYRPGGC